jgi:hypothetical protein
MAGAGHEGLLAAHPPRFTPATITRRCDRLAELEPVPAERFAGRERELERELVRVRDLILADIGGGSRG